MGAMKTLPLPRFAWLQTRALWLVLALSVTGLVAPAHALRIKEVASVQGVRSNQLSGYGLVVGLDGTGDQSTQMPFTAQAMANYLQQMGISLPPGTSAPQLKNVAAVVITAQLPAFAQPGQNIDVAVSSIGNAKSLRGGTLIAAPLRGADGEIYALAQGNVVVGGAGASAGGSKVQINHLSAGRIPGGAQVERSVPTPCTWAAPSPWALMRWTFRPRARWRRPSMPARARAPPPRWTGAACR